MLKRFLKDAIIYFFANGLFGISHILFFIIAANFIPEQGIGTLELGYSLIVIIQLVIPLEISQSTGRFLPEGTDSDRTRIFTTSLLFTISSYLIFSMIFFPLSSTVSEWLTGTANNSSLLKWAFSAAIFWGIFFHTRNQLRWFSMSSAYLIVVILYSIVFIFSFSLSFHYSLFLNNSLFFCIIIASIPSIFISLILTKKYLSFSFDNSTLTRLLLFSMPLVPSSLSVYFSQYFDRLAIANMLTMHDLGLYALGSRVAMIAHLGIIGFQGAFMPLIYENYKKDETPQFVDTSLRLFLTITSPIVIGIAFFSNDLILFKVVPSTYSIGMKVAPILTLAILFSRLYIFAPGLSLQKKTSLIAITNLIVAIINILLTILLINSMGIIGAAIGTAISSAFGALIYFILGQRFYQIPFRTIKITFTLLLVSSLSCVEYLFSTLLKVFSWNHLITIKIFLFVIFTLLIFILISTKKEKRILLEHLRSFKIFHRQ